MIDLSVNDVAITLPKALIADLCGTQRKSYFGYLI
jgi:hypothetical protein